MVNTATQSSHTISAFRIQRLAEPTIITRIMLASEALSRRPDDIFEALIKGSNDFFETLSERLDKASPGLLTFGNLLSLILRGAVFTHNQIMFNLLVAHMVRYRWLAPFGRSHLSKSSTAYAMDRSP
jgi:hypothetical protein